MLAVGPNQYYIRESMRRPPHQRKCFFSSIMRSTRSSFQAKRGRVKTKFDSDRVTFRLRNSSKIPSY